MISYSMQAVTGHRIDFTVSRQIPGVAILQSVCRISVPVTETLSHTFVLNYLMVKLKVDINYAMHTVSCISKFSRYVRPTLLELDGRTKIFRVGPIYPEKNGPGGGGPIFPAEILVLGPFFPGPKFQ